MGLAPLSKVTIISPRSEYEGVAKALAQLEDFHPLDGAAQDFDPAVQELTVKAVRLFSQADQAVKDLGLQVMPGWMDMVFRGAKIEKSKFEASEWEELLARAESDLEPISQEVKAQKTALQRVSKVETDAQTLRDALQALSGFSADFKGLGDLRRLKAVVCVVPTQAVAEFRNSLPDPIFQTQTLDQTEALVLVAVKSSDGPKLDKAIKALNIRQLQIPPSLPQNPAQAYVQLSKDYEAAKAERVGIEQKFSEVRGRTGSKLLAVRELTESARDMLDEARVSGEMKRLATISGYIPSKKEERFRQLFGKWMVYSEPVGRHHEDEKVPVLMENRRGVRLWQLITKEQGIPGGEEVDPTPLISFVFPVFFGLMFGDFGHGLVFTLFLLFVRQRVFGTKRQWANIFLVTGVSSMVFGVLFGEFFGYSLYPGVPPPWVVEIVSRPQDISPRPDIPIIEGVMVVAILIGVAHLITALVLDVYEAARARERLDLVIEKVPALTMYLSGVGYGLAFIGAGFKFDVLDTSVSAPLVGIPVNVLGGISLAVLVPSMLILLAGKSVAVKLGKIKDVSVATAISDGGLEVFEKILLYLSNTISYVRLAVMLLVHAVLLLIVNSFFPITNPVMIPAWVVFNLMVLAIEALIVYVQDLRLHVYEFFTKFYIGTGKPFRKILPDRARVLIDWL